MRWPLIRYIPRSTHFRFVRWAPVAAVVSAVLIVASIALLFLQGLNLGIDFKGGKNHSSALSQAAGSGNYHVCETSLSVILISPTGMVSCGGGVL